MSTSHANEPSDQLIEMAFTDSEEDLAAAQPEQPSEAHVIEPSAADEIFPQEQSFSEEDPLLAFMTEGNDTSSPFVSAKSTFSAPAPSSTTTFTSSPSPSTSAPNTLTWGTRSAAEDSDAQPLRSRSHARSGVAPSLRAVDSGAHAATVPERSSPNTPAAPRSGAAASRWMEETQKAAAPRDASRLSYLRGLFSWSSLQTEDPHPSSAWARLTPVVIFLGLLAFAAVGFVAYELLTRARVPAATAAVAQSGMASINSRPAGASVVVDGVERGVTPIKLTLPLGTHTLELKNGAEVRTVPLTVEAGTMVSQYIDLLPEAPPAAPASALGALEIASDPAGADVQIDGNAKGKTPLTLGNIPAGTHTVVIGKGPSAITRRLKVTPGATTSVQVSLKAEALSAGWVTFKVPVELKVYEEGRLVGTTGADRLMLSSGRHDLEVGSESLDFKTKVAVQVQAGQVTNLTVKIPNGSLSVNAAPWASVTVDGEDVGVTPLANLSLPIGTHDVVWKHPELGERRRTVIVTASSPTRIGMDFRK